MSLLPEIQYEIDINKPLRTTELEAVQGSDFEIIVRVKRCGVVQTVEGVTPTLIVANSAQDWVRTFTGTAGGANDESLTIPVAGTSLDSNGSMDYDIKLTDADGNTPIWRRGTLVLYAAVPDSVTPPAGSPIDWSDYSSYVSTATDGPYTAGSGIVFGTADADGRVPISADGTETDWGEISGTLSDQTDLQSALDAKADDDAVVKLTGNQTISSSKTFDRAVQLNDGLKSDGNLSPATDNTGTLGAGTFLNERWALGLIVKLVSDIIQAGTAAGIALKDSTGTTQATVDSTGLTLTTDLAVTEGGTGASTTQGAVYNLSGTRTATMTGDETLTTSSEPMQFLDPDGSDRNLDLPNGTTFVVQNTGDGGEVITVRDASDVTIDEVDNGVTLTFMWDGSNWQVMG